MINWSEMQRPNDVEPEIPIATNERVRNIIRRKINTVRKCIESPFIHLSYPYGGGSRSDYRRDLFSFTANDDSFLTEDLGRKDRFSPSETREWRVDSEHLQELGLKIMKDEYGLDESISQPVRPSRDWTKDGTKNNGDGTMSEIRLYPKTAIDGLAFECFRVFCIATGNTSCVYWDVVDNAPSRINWGNRTKNKLNPAPII